MCRSILVKGDTEPFSEIAWIAVAMYRVLKGGGYLIEEGRLLVALRD